MTAQHIAGTIGILGAEWLGLPLARTLLVAGKPVAVTVRSSEKAARLQGGGDQRPSADDLCPYARY
ncbi:Rossmann-fold NAD(P)-binding domain-containing protein [Aeromonas rivipollensis]|uniref:hypothetical protein n=1 Tax=Aeromonas rivipollensis TaxID=948519 RepID=UPI0038CF5D89